jgi:hypothetical protein
MLTHLVVWSENNCKSFCEKSYQITEPRDGDGYNCLKVQGNYWNNIFPDEYEINLE